MVAWDMPGFGSSEPMASPSVNVSEYARALHELIQAIGIDNAHIVGTSFGTLIAAATARLMPEAVRSMVWVCSVRGMGRLDPSKRAELRATRLQELTTLGVDQFAETRNSKYLGRGAPQDVIAKAVSLARMTTVRGYMDAYAAMTECDIDTLCSGWRKPLMALSGEQDPIAPASQCEQIANRMAGAQYHCVSGAGHYLNFERPHVFNELVSNFIDATEEGVGVSGSA